MEILKGLKRKAVLLALIDKMNKTGSWSGETHIQKAMYFLQTVCKVPTGYDFILYKYGPFSFDLRDELSEMLTNNILKIKLQPYPYGSSYSLGDLADNLFERYPVTTKKYKKKIHLIAEKIATYDVADLEKLSTALYFMQEKRLDKISELAKKINSVKPHITRDDANVALKQVSTFCKSHSLVAK